MANGTKEVKVFFPPHLQGGVYSNNLMISHTKEEFIMDFMMVTHSGGAVTARVITSPGHMKRIINALETNVKRYEDAHGKIQMAEPPKGNVEFHA
jgi:hypothetical protein